MSVNDPKDPTTWTPEMIRRFNAYRPGTRDAESTRNAPTVGPGTPATWSPDYAPRNPLDRVLMVSIQEPPDVPVRPEFIAALEAVARAAEVVVRTQAQAGPVSVAGGDVADRIIDMENVLAALREARR